ncbi:MAG: hypothetical protein HUJ75_06555, partial [Parasporobacterium sp.]|nr:hypothetical protein [Parasporobacterium sp.]
MTTLFWSNLIWIIPLVCAAVCLILGDLISIVTKALPGVARKLASGFVGALAVFHIESLPFMFLDLSFSLLCIIYGCTLGALIVVYVILNITGKRIPFKEDIDYIVENEKYIKSHDWWKFIVWALALVLIFFQIRNVILYVQFNVDDNFYVAESVTALSRDRIMSVLPASGIEGSKFPVMYLLVSFEAFISFIAKTFSIAPAALCHSVLPAFFIPLHYVCLALVGKELGKGKCGIFVLFAAILNWVSGPFTYSQGAFLILRIWQGKAVLVNIIFPLVLYIFIRILKEKKLSLKYGIYLCALLLTGQAASTVGTYLVPLLYAVYAVAFLIIVRKWKEFFKLFIPAALITPFVGWKLYILISTSTLGSISEGTGVKAKTFMEIFTRFFGWSTLPLIFVLALVVLLLKLKKDEDEAYVLRFFFLISSAILIVLFINPVVMPFVES